MRRGELEMNDRAELERLLREVEWGTLTLQTGDDWPYAVPMNHAYADGTLAFHCAPTGKRVALLGKDPRIQYTVVREYARIPSYAISGDNASGATQFFRSVMAWGRARLVEAPAEKARFLKTLMEQQQPEGGYAEILPDSRTYSAMLNHVCVIAVSIESMTGKFKFGQNLSDEKAAELIAFLEKRQGPRDAETIEWMRRLRKVRS
jgi:nitroimidazol reductase NimA-like FMN-containing flavoprotein (pyridoxamine 5'-phosphate oxidase superfamily)